MCADYSCTIFGGRLCGFKPSWQASGWWPWADSRSAWTSGWARRHLGGHEILKPLPCSGCSSITAPTGADKQSFIETDTGQPTSSALSIGAAVLRMNKPRTCFVGLAGIRLQPVAGQASPWALQRPGARRTNPRRAFSVRRSCGSDFLLGDPVPTRHWEVSMSTVIASTLYLFHGGTRTILNRADLLRQMAAEARNAVVRDGYIALLAEWQAKEISQEPKKADAS